MPITSWEALRFKQNDQYAKKQVEYVNQYRQSELNKLILVYNKNPWLRREMWEYANDYRKSIYGKTKEERELANKNLKFIETRFKTNDQFKQWKDHFLNRQRSDEDIWAGYSTSEGRGDYKAIGHGTLRAHSYNIFKELNEVSGLEDTSRSVLSNRLQYTPDKKDNGTVYYGTVGKNKDFADITVAWMTGSKMYNHNSIPRQVSKIIKGQRFYTDAAHISSRRYGSGVMKGKGKDVILENVLFDNPEVIAKITKLGSAEELKKYGVSINYEGNSKNINGVSIPIASTFDSDITESFSAINEDKTRYGASKANHYSLTRQASRLR